MLRRPVPVLLCLLVPLACDGAEKKDDSAPEAEEKPALPEPFEGELTYALL